MKRLAVLGTLLLAACASMPSNDAGEAIRSMSRDFGTAAGSGNVDAMMSIYADDAVLMPPNLPAFRGRNAIRQFWSGFLGAGKIEATLTPDNIMQSCDMATEVGHYALSITPT